MVFAGLARVYRPHMSLIHIIRYKSRPIYALHYNIDIADLTLLIDLEAWLLIFNKIAKADV